jgi:hypothetical protein
LEQIKALKPVRCYIGKDSWLGYVVFEFTHSASVVLECPIEGNATYVLSGDWKAMVGHTKAELRHRFANRYTRIVHKPAGPPGFAQHFATVEVREQSREPKPSYFLLTTEIRS